MKSAKAFGPPSSPPSPGFTLQEGLWFGDFDDEQAAQTAAASMAAMAGRIMGARPFPAAAQKLVQLTRNDDADINQVVRVLEMDPGLSQRVLRLVNSAGYGLRIRCTSLGHATALLGQVKLRQIATSAALFDHFGKPSPITRRKQEHASLVASLCRYLAIHLGLPQDDLFTIGLLHDLGQLMMLDDGQVDYTALVESHEDSFDSLYLAERELLGFDHAILAGQVLASWSIPAPLPEVIALHHQPALAHQRGLDISAMVQTLRFADQMAHLLEHARGRADGPRELAESEAASYLDFSEVQIAAMWRDLQSVHEATKNRRLNIFDVAPRTVRVPASLSPRERGFSVPPSYASFLDPGTSPSLRPGLSMAPEPSIGSVPERLGIRPTETIAVTSYHPPVQSLRAGPPSQHPSDRGSVPPSPSPRLLSGPLDLVPLDADAPVAIYLPGEDSGEEPAEGPASGRSSPPSDRMVLSSASVPPRHATRQPSRPPADEQAALAAQLPPLFAPRITEPPTPPLEEDFFQESGAPEHDDRDPSPEIFPCSLCYGPTFGATCHACGASVCSLHQTSNEWCVACEAEFRSHRHEHPISSLVVLSAGVAVGVASLSTWFFSSFESALGVVGLSSVTALGAYVLHQAWLKVRFKRARRISRWNERPRQEEHVFRAPIPEDATPPWSEPAPELEAPPEPAHWTAHALADEPTPSASSLEPAPSTSVSPAHPPREVHTIRAAAAPEASPAWAFRSRGLPDWTQPEVPPVPEASNNEIAPSNEVAPLDEAAPPDPPASTTSPEPLVTSARSEAPPPSSAAPVPSVAPGPSASERESLHAGQAPTALPPPPPSQWMDDAHASLAAPAPEHDQEREREREAVARLSYDAPTCTPGTPEARIIVPPLAPPEIHCVSIPEDAVGILDSCLR